MAYCEITDLLLGDIPTPTYVDLQKMVNDAADEIDSKIGYVYQTPVDVSLTSNVVRPARLLLKRINAHLATGRIILMVASPEENANLHAYGYHLVKEAILALDQIAAGQISLEGATEVVSDLPQATVPMISNLDSESQVEAFYDRIANPNYLFYPLGYHVANNPDSLVDE